MLLDKAPQQGIVIKENRYFESDADAILCKNTIGISYKLEATKQKKCAIAEEFAHYELNTGDIVDQSKAENRKQEYLARKRSVPDLISLSELVEAFKKGFRSADELAEEFGITEKFLKEAIDILRKTYGEKKVEEDYTFYFEPYLYFRDNNTMPLLENIY